MSKKSTVGQSALIFFYFFYLSAKLEIVVPESDSGISFSKFPVSRHLFWSCNDELCIFLPSLNRKCLPFLNTWLTPVFGGICVAHLFSFLCCVLVLFFFVLFLVPHVDCVPVHSWLSLLFPLTSIYFLVTHFQQIKFCIIFTRVCKVMKVYLCSLSSWKLKFKSSQNLPAFQLYNNTPLYGKFCQTVNLSIILPTCFC
jgi:hypothetical protein